MVVDIARLGSPKSIVADYLELANLFNEYMVSEVNESASKRSMYGKTQGNGHKKP